MSVFRLSLPQDAPPSPFEAVPVLPTPTHTEIWPTAIVEAEDGSLVYGDAVPGHWWMGTRTLMRRIGGETRAVDTIRFEFRFTGESREAVRGRTLVVAEMPRSARRVHLLPLRGASTSHRRAGAAQSVFEDLRTVAAPESLDDHAALAAVEALSWDWWETGKDVVAAYSRPPGAYVSPDYVRDPAVREHWMPASTQRNGATFALGLIDDFDRLMRAVMLAPAWDHLQRQFDTGWFRPPLRNIADLPDRIPLIDSVHHNLLQHLEIAVRQAAAGPYREGDDWRGRSVVGKALDHLMSHVYEANRQAAGANGDQRVIEIPLEDWDGSFVSDGRVRAPHSDG